jgi:hypothetical protein
MSHAQPQLHRLPVLALALTAFTASFAQTAQPTAKADTALKAELMETVTKLASPEFKGRDAAMRETVVKYLGEAFQKAGLKPVGKDFARPFKSKDGDGVNVVGMIPGSDAKLKDEHLLIGAHWDHLGQKGDQIFPGAGDNASGVATILATAKRVALAKPKHTILVVAFDLEEKGLVGSNAYAEDPALPLAKCDGALIIDILGRKGLGMLDDYLFVTGWEWTPDALDLTQAAAKTSGLTLAHFGSDIPGDRSDFAAFRNKKVPYLFFSVGEYPEYHQPSDTADKLDGELFARQATLIGDIFRRWDGTTKRWTIRSTAQINPLEFRAFADLCKAVSTAAGSMLPEPMRAEIAQLESWSRALSEKKEIAAEERDRLVESARMMQAQMQGH